MCVFFWGGREHHDFIIIIIIIIPLFITFGNKNYGNITIKFKTLHIIYTYQIKLSLAPLAIKDSLCLTVRDTGIMRCTGLVLQDLRLWP